MKKKQQPTNQPPKPLKNQPCTPFHPEIPTNPQQ